MSDEPVFTPVDDPTVTPAATVAGEGSKKSAKSLLKGKKKLKLGKGKTSKKKKIIIGVSAVAVLAIAGLVIPAVMGLGAPKYDPTAVYRGDVATVTKDDVIKSLNMTGTLKSAKSMTLFSSLNSKVQTLNVKAGDRVSQGQLLAQLDSSEAMSQLSSQQSQLNESRITQQNSIDEAAQNYQNAKSALDQGLNQDIRGAQTALHEAQNEYVKASRAYDRMKKDKASGSLPAITENDAALRSALQEYENAKLNASRLGLGVSQAEKERDMASVDAVAAGADLQQLQQELTTLKNKTSRTADEENRLKELPGLIAEAKATALSADAATKAAQEALDSAYTEKTAANTAVRQASENLAMARRRYKSNLRAIDEQLAEAGEAVAKAQTGISDAKVALESAKIHAAQEVNSNLRALRAAQATAGSGMAEGQSAIQKLRADINSAHVTSPMAGIVTSVTAKVGATPEGSLMTVEDDQNMVIETQIKESGVSKLSVGNQVTFTTPATGDKEFTGTVAFISPAALDQTSAPSGPGADQGSGSGGGNASVMFPVQITVTGGLQGLRLGSTAKVKAIIAGQKNVLTVPKGALVDAMIPLDGKDSSSNEAPVSGGMMAPGTSADDGPKSVLVIDNPDSEQPKIREVPVEVLVEGNGMAAIKGKGIKEGTTVLDNALNYLDLVGETGHYVDTPQVMEGTVE
ncbi:efflux RND transporter periplasmic adaptor subunit [uncultured Mobiluncus sp.]|uniref:efflux RND transporter periplasmic adaptor subunit n=1 Tax=uncultured Mobiluncus sp. TaxID=293425 RepID=UPI00280475EA|nr:efflux RND transporter periplasmic adaptor subunit [uncultured Mobiluncus sp.]